MMIIDTYSGILLVTVLTVPTISFAWILKSSFFTLVWIQSTPTRRDVVLATTFDQINVFIITIDYNLYFYHFLLEYNKIWLYCIPKQITRKKRRLL